MAPTRQIEADIARYKRALDASIDLVTSRSARPTRAWSMACKSLRDRIEELKAQLTHSTSQRPADNRGEK